MLSNTLYLYSWVINSLSQYLEIAQEKICQFKNNHRLDDLIGESHLIKHIKRININVQVNSPIKELLLGLHRNTHTISTERYFNSLHEFVLYHPADIYLPSKNRRQVRFWRWGMEDDFEPPGIFHFVKQNDIKMFYRILLACTKKTELKVDPPILPARMLNEIYANSVGFLLNAQKLKPDYEKHQIPFRRGILLCGTMGCGKTLACRWLRYLCQRNNLYTRIVTVSQYERARSNDHVATLFRFSASKPGIVFFDDMDVMLKSRASSSGYELQTFLSQLDGIVPHEGVIYVFTTNAVKELDEAIVRPGRIDLFLNFQPPDKNLRLQFIHKKFHDDLKKCIDLDEFAEKTDNYTFAEIEEVRKLLAMDLIQQRTVNMLKTFSVFEQHRKAFVDRATIGFNQIKDDVDDPIGEPLDDLRDFGIPPQ